MKKKNKGITLIALVITIIVLIILATISINTVFYDNGLITRAEEAKFKTEVNQYKEVLDMQKLSLSANKTTNIYELKEQLEKQIESLSVGSENAQKGVNIIQTAESSFSEIHDCLNRILELLHNIKKLTPGDENYETNIATIKTEIEQLISEINRIANETKYEEIFLLNGDISAKNPYTIKFSNEYFEQGSIEIIIEDTRWNNIYESEEIDYNNIDGSIEKLENTIEKISEKRSIAGGKQNALEDAIEYLDSICEEITVIYSDIFHSDTSETGYATEEEAIKSAKSWNTTTNFIWLADIANREIDSKLQRIRELAIVAENDTRTDFDRKSIQCEIDEGLETIERIINYAGISDKKIFNGTFPYTERMSLDTLGIRNISTLTIEKAKEAQTKVDNAIEIISSQRTEYNTKLEEIASKLEEEADNGYAFEITETLNLTVEIPEEYKDKLQIINGELTYIGNDEKERKWAKEIGINVL